MSALLAAFPEAETFDEARMDDVRAGKITVWVANPASLSHGIDGIQDAIRADQRPHPSHWTGESRHDISNHGG